MKGRKFERVRFKVTKAALRIADDEAMRLRISHRQAQEAKVSPRPGPAYQIDDALAIIRKEAKGLDAHALLTEFDAGLQSSKKPVQNVLGALTIFARRKAKEYGGGLFNHALD